MTNGVYPCEFMQVELGCSATAHLLEPRAGLVCRQKAVGPVGGCPHQYLAVVGLNHRSATLAIRSAASLVGERLADFLAQARAEGLRECAVLSTCNRTEVYFAGAAAPAVLALLARFSSLCEEDLDRVSYQLSGICAVCHLFRVTAGLDSAVLGESEFVLQVKEAWKAAAAQGTCGPALDLLFQRSLETGKRVRTETPLSRISTSVASLAVREATTLAGGLAGKTVLVVGAGVMGERVLRELQPCSLGRITVANRTPANAVSLAEKYKAETASLSDLGELLAVADVVFACAASPEPIISGEALSAASRCRAGRRLVVLDLGLPPNVAEFTGDPEIAVVHMDTMEQASFQNASLRARGASQALAIVDEELDRFRAALKERAAAPTIQALVERAEDIRRRNLDWAVARLGELDPKHQRTVEELTRRLVVGLLEGPIDSLKTDLHDPEHCEIAERLFKLRASGGTDDGS